MKYKQCGTKVFVRIDKGEEIVETLKHLCEHLDITLGTITGIGATDTVTIGLFDVSSKTYRSKQLTGDHEIVPLYGNITTMNNEVYLHLHINLCDEQNRSFGGHLNTAVVSATFEGVIDVVNGSIDRKKDEIMQLNLLDL